MNFQIINDGAAAGLTYDINSGFAQMAQMPLRNDVVKTVAVDALTTKTYPPKVNAGIIPSHLNHDEKEQLILLYNKYPLLTYEEYIRVSTPLKGYSNYWDLIQKDLDKIYSQLNTGTPIDVSKPKNATTDINPNTPTDAAKKTNWLLIGGIGLGVAALAALVISKRKKNKAKLNGTVGAVSKKTVRTKKTKRNNSSKKGGHKVVTI